MTTPTPRTDELKKALWQLMQAQESERIYAWRDAIHCGIELLERELAAEQEKLLVAHEKNLYAMQLMDETLPGMDKSAPFEACVRKLVAELARVRDKCNEHYMAAAAAQEARERAEKLVRELEQSMGVMASDGNHETRRSDSDVGPAERPRNAVTPTYSELQESLSVYVALAAAQSDRAQRAEERAERAERDAERYRKARSRTRSVPEVVPVAVASFPVRVMEMLEIEVPTDV